MTNPVHQNLFGDDFWGLVCSLQQMPKLQELSTKPQHLFEGYYQVGPCEYVFASNQWNFAFTEEALFVLHAIWAPSLAAFCRAKLRADTAISGDDGASGLLPIALRLQSDSTTFSTIRQRAFMQPELRPSEMDLYHSKEGMMGAPTGHIIFAHPFSYYFRSYTPVPEDEAPFAVSCNTKHDPHAHWPLG